MSPTALDVAVFEELDPPADADPVLRRFGLFMRRTRHGAAMSQHTLAYRTGVPQSMISRSERGLHPGMHLIRIARILDELGALEPPPDPTPDATSRMDLAWRLGRPKEPDQVS